MQKYIYKAEDKDQEVMLAESKLKIEMIARQEKKLTKTTKG